MQLTWWKAEALTTRPPSWLKRTINISYGYDFISALLHEPNAFNSPLAITIISFPNTNLELYLTHNPGRCNHVISIHQLGTTWAKLTLYMTDTQFEILPFSSLIGFLSTISCFIILFYLCIVNLSHLKCPFWIILHW